MIDKIPENITFSYELVKKIGEGANGETWLIRDRVKKTQAILKFLKFLSAEDLKTVELFQREAELLKSIHLEGVPAFYEYDTDEAGNGYLIEEFISAPSIQDMLDEGVIFDESETLAVAIKIAEIIVRLQHDYSPPIIHRDIKPSNMMYQRESGRVWLIDFGSVAHPQKRTGGSTIAGTFGYMPPEQVFGNIALQSDYYALGATMLHMLTGVFPGEMASNMYQIRIKTILADKAPETSEQMIGLLQSMLSAEIEKRPQTADELLNRLQKVQQAQKPQHILDRLKSFAEDFKTSISQALRRYNSRLKTETAEYSGFPVQPSPFWHHAEGKLQCCKDLREEFQRITQTTPQRPMRYSVYYTFEAKGRTWTGHTAINTKDELKKFRIPGKSDALDVLYDPLFPRNNILCVTGENQTKSSKEPER